MNGMTSIAVSPTRISHFSSDVIASGTLSVYNIIDEKCLFGRYPSILRSYIRKTIVNLFIIPENHYEKVKIILIELFKTLK